MVDLHTSYMGIKLANPVVVGACSLSKKIDNIRALEDAGVGALVIKSLFEEQIQMEDQELDNSLNKFDNLFAEAISMFPKLDHSGPKEHLFWVKKTREAVKMPLFASLNALTLSSWVQYAKELENTGVDGLELNFYSPPMDKEINSSEIEKRELDILANVRAAVKIPIAVKLHPYYTSLMHVTSDLEKAGANALVLFNRLFDPDINIEKLKKDASRHYSNSHDSLLPLRWMGLLSEKLKLDLIASSGLYSGKDVIKMILAGAEAVQLVSAFYTHGPLHITTILKEMETWMRAHNFEKLDDFRGYFAKKKSTDSWSFERGQYIKAVLGID